MSIQQYKSKDGRIVIDHVSNIHTGCIYPQADFSIVAVPQEPQDSFSFFRQMYKTQRSNHCMLAHVRLPRRMRLKVYANLIKAEDAGFKYHDHVTLVSQEEYKSIPNNLTQIGETLVLLTKTDDVRKEATQWFRPDLNNCSNVWDVTQQDYETLNQKTVSRHFNFETGILMANLSSPLICRKFIIVGQPELSHTEFAFHFDLNMYCVTDDELSARRAIRWYDKFQEKRQHNK